MRRRMGDGSRDMGEGSREGMEQAWEGDGCASRSSDLQAPSSCPQKGLLNT